MTVLSGAASLAPERGAHAPAEPAGRGGAEVASRRAEAALRRVEVVLVDQNRVLVDEVADALGDPHHLERLLALRLLRGRCPRLAKAPVLGVPALRPLGDGASVGALPYRLGERGQVQADRARAARNRPGSRGSGSARRAGRPRSARSSSRGAAPSARGTTARRTRPPRCSRRRRGTAPRRSPRAADDPGGSSCRCGTDRSPARRGPRRASPAPARRGDRARPPW